LPDQGFAEDVTKKLLQNSNHGFLLQCVVSDNSSMFIVLYDDPKYNFENDLVDRSEDEFK